MPLDGSKEQHLERLSLGLPYALVGISHADQILLDHLLLRHPQWQNIVEFGTHVGITSMILGLTCKLRGGRFWTFNNHDDRLPQVKEAWLDNMTHIVADLLPVGGKADRIACATIQSAGPCLVIFDNGDKAEEIRRYASSVPVGSAIAVHDWRDELQNGEVEWNDVKDILGTSQWRDLMLDERRQWKSGFRCWVRVQGWDEI